MTHISFADDVVEGALAKLLMNSKDHFRVTVDPLNNTLKISFIGEIASAEMPYYQEQLAKAVEQLNAGFSLLTDLTELSSMAPECVPFLKASMDFLNKRGIGLIVRVVPDQSKDIGLNILSLFHYRQGLEIFTVQTQQEAFQLLGEQKAQSMG